MARRVLLFCLFSISSRIDDSSTTYSMCGTVLLCMLSYSRVASI
jgi:hypothetical protein